MMKGHRMDPLGISIREMRKALGQTQAQFAKRIGTTQAMVARWETGQAPTDVWIVKLHETAESAGLDEHAKIFAGVDLKRTRARPEIEIRSDEETEEVNAVLRIVRNPKEYATEYPQLKKLTERARKDNAIVLAHHQGKLDGQRAIIQLHEQGKSAAEIAEMFGIHEEAISVFVAFHR